MIGSRDGAGTLMTGVFISSREGRRRNQSRRDIFVFSVIEALLSDLWSGEKRRFRAHQSLLHCSGWCVTLLAVVSPWMSCANALSTFVTMTTHAVCSHPCGVWNLWRGPRECSWSGGGSRQSGKRIFSKQRGGQMSRVTFDVALCAVRKKLMRHPWYSDR